MATTQEDALSALSATCGQTYNRALANLKALTESRTWFSNPHKHVRAYALDEITRSLEVGSGDEGSFILLTSLDGAKVNFVMHERLMTLATHMVTCNLLQNTVDRTMKAPALAQQLLLGTQSIAILASLIDKFAAFAAFKQSKGSNRADVEGAPDEALARKYSDDFGSDIKRSSKLLVDHKQAGELIMSLSLPYPPVIVSHKKRPDGRILNGVWMTADMASHWKDHWARQQADALHRVPGRR